MKECIIVNRIDVMKKERQMREFLKEANQVSGNSTYKALSDALKALYIAEGFYKVLEGLGLFEPMETAGEDRERIEKKISDILEEKRRMDFPRWKH